MEKLKSNFRHLFSSAIIGIGLAACSPDLPTPEEFPQIAASATQPNLLTSTVQYVNPDTLHEVFPLCIADSVHLPLYLVSGSALPFYRIKFGTFPSQAPEMAVLWDHPQLGGVLKCHLFVGGPGDPAPYNVGTGPNLNLGNWITYAFNPNTPATTFALKYSSIKWTVQKKILVAMEIKLSNGNTFILSTKPFIHIPSSLCCS